VGAPRNRYNVVKMSISFERFNPEKHYARICEWWEAQKWPPIPLDILSSEGIVMTHAGKPVSACWIYTSNSAVAWLEFFVADPTAEKNIRNSCIDKMIEVASAIATHFGVKAIFSTVKVRKLIFRLKENGFAESDTGMTIMIRSL
jgi:hypothetical protein